MALSRKFHHKTSKLLNLKDWNKNEIYLIILYYSYISPEGETINVQYVADENGFQPESDAIPPTPPHVNELLKIADEQRAQGIQFDERGFEV